MTKKTNPILGAEYERGETHTVMTFPNCFADGIIALLTHPVGSQMFEKIVVEIAEKNPKNLIQMVNIGLASAAAAGKEETDRVLEAPSAALAKGPR